MDKSKKILLISLIPVALTLVFVVYLLMPSIDGYKVAQEELQTEQESFDETRQKLDLKHENSRLLKEVRKLQSKLGSFKVEVPFVNEDEEAILLVDLDKFSIFSNVKITSMGLNQEKLIEIKKDDQKKKKSRKRKDNQEKAPMELSVIPFDIKISGNYPDLLKFVDALEKYQRKIVISSISASSEQKNDKANNVEMTINCNIYRLVKNDATPADETTEQKG